MGEAIHEALSMSEEEKAARWGELYKSIVTNSAQNFASSILNELARMRLTSNSSHVPRLDADEVKKAFQSSQRCL